MPDEPQTHGSDGYRLALYAAGTPPLVREAAERIRHRFTDKGIPLELTMIDVLQEPDRALRERIFATPTLVRHAPLPEKRVIGDLSVTDVVMRLLEIPVS